MGHARHIQRRLGIGSPITTINALAVVLSCILYLSRLDSGRANAFHYTLGGACAKPPLRNGAVAQRARARGEARPRAARAKPSLDHPPPAASLTWPRWIPLIATAYAALQGFRRKLFGGAEAVALDPALPWAVRWELIKSRKELRSKGKTAPRAFQSMLKDSADTLEELPALLVTVAVLAGDLLRGSKKNENTKLRPFRRLGEAQALLFTAGRLHMGIDDDESKMRLLGGDFLFAEGQWTMAELGSFPAIRCTAKMIRDVSDGTSKGGAAASPRGSVSEIGPHAALRSAFLHAGTYFAMVSGGAGWIDGADAETVAALRRYGFDLGCALKLAQCQNDLRSQDLALWLATSAKEALLFLRSGNPRALRGMRRLAHRVERSCQAAIARLVRLEDNRNVRGLSCSEFHELKRTMDDAVFFTAGTKEGDDGTFVQGPGFQRDDMSDNDMHQIVRAGLYGIGPDDIEPVSLISEGGAKAALDRRMRDICIELKYVEKLLDGTFLAEPAMTAVVRDEVIELFRTSGKRLRPALVLMVALALKAPEASVERVTKLAASVELLHCASLVHDDILDGADLRRGKKTAHNRLGDRAATLVGDFLFASASVLVADIGNLAVLLLMYKVVADFGRGELAQSAIRFEAVGYSLEDYLAKSFYKTASLLAAACQAAAVLSGVEPHSEQARACYRYGAYLGLAFQVVDDVLDFASTEDTLGKPVLADLKEGILSAPVLFAAQERIGPNGGKALRPAQRRELIETIERKLSSPGDFEVVVGLVEKAEGVAQAKRLARRFADLSIAELSSLPAGPSRDSLRVFAEFVVERTF